MSNDPATERAAKSSQLNEAICENSRRRRRLADVFGDDLPSQTADERDEGHSRSATDWYERNRPPHYE